MSKKTDGRIKWTKQEEKYLLENFQNSTYKEIASYLNKSMSSVLGKAQALSIQGDKKDTLWSDKEVKFLLNSYKNTTVNEISVSLNRTKGSVRAKMNVLNLDVFKNKIKNGTVKKYIQISEADNALISKHYGSLRKMIEYHLKALKNDNKTSL